MTEERRPTREELLETAEQHLSLHQAAFVALRSRLHEIAAELNAAGNEMSEVWCALEGACRNMRTESEAQIYFAEMRDMGASQSALTVVESAIQLFAETHSGQLDTPPAELTDQGKPKDAMVEGDEAVDGDPIWGDG